MALHPYEEETPYREGPDISKPVKRIRWATRRVTGQKGRTKRQSIIDRLHKRTASAEKKRESGSQDSSATKDEEHSRSDSDQGGVRRTIYFNRPLPDDARDEQGHPKQHFVRNKVRTAKYTPISFVPKNLYFQFHNIANIYFLFIIILSVSHNPPPRVRGPPMQLHTDLLHIRSVESGAQCGPAYSNRLRNSSQGRCRRLAADSSGQ